MANTIHTVVKGDTLWDLAIKYNTTVNKLVELNDIENPDFIVIGQKLIVSGTANNKKNTTWRAEVKSFGLLSNGTDLYASWKWNKTYTENYQVQWWYKDAANWLNDWIQGSDSTVNVKQSTFSIPSNAKQVKFLVKPIAKKRKINGKEADAWTASWSTEKIHNVQDPPDAPSAPNIDRLENKKLTVSVSNVEADGGKVIFQVYKVNSKSVYKSATVSIINRRASHVFGVESGSEYVVRCQVLLSGLYSEWSPYSNPVLPPPAKVSSISTIRAESETSVYLKWTSIVTAESYDIEYTTDKNYFGSSNMSTIVNDIDTSYYLLGNLQSGDEYFFRVRAVNSGGESEWSPIASVIIGTDPIAPTTWSSVVTATVGEDVTLFWVHNSEDGSNETYAEIEFTVDGSVVYPTTIIENKDSDEDEIKTRSYILKTDSYTEGTKILWRVRTSGVTKNFGDWSIQRTIDVYAQPTLELRMLSVSEDGWSDPETLEEVANPDFAGELHHLPFYISAIPGPATQAPIGYYLTITSNDSYESADFAGNDIYVKAGDSVYSKYFDIHTHLMVEIGAGDINLENNKSYTVTCTASMDSGLSAEASLIFQVLWEDTLYEPNAEIGLDEEIAAAYIRPYCEDVDGNPIPDVTLSVYRREFDGTFTELMTGIDNSSNTFITDPHPALDYARYRVVATDIHTGSISYCDIAPYPVNEKAVIIQWDDDWSDFEGIQDGAWESPVWAGSLLRLPYNIDVTENNQSDVTMVKYIGRTHPVSYYGTHVGETATWNVAIEKNDEETLYALRRLQKWMGDVYVREPSGCGYWASISVSFSQKHKEVTIPVTLNITRVEGGV